MSVLSPPALSEGAVPSQSKTEEASTFPVSSTRRIDTFGESHAPVMENGMTCVGRCGSSATALSSPHEPALPPMLTAACMPDTFSGVVRASKKLLAGPVQKHQTEAVSPATYDVLSSVRFWIVALSPRRT